MTDPDTPDIDARGWRCPQPVIALARQARDAPVGQTIWIWADDPAARFDIPAWGRMKGHRVRLVDEADYTRYEVILQAPPSEGTSS